MPVRTRLGMHLLSAACHIADTGLLTIHVNLHGVKRADDEGHHHARHKGSHGTRLIVSQTGTQTQLGV